MLRLFSLLPVAQLIHFQYSFGDLTYGPPLSDLRTSLRSYALLSTHRRNHLRTSEPSPSDLSTHLRVTFVSLDFQHGLSIIARPVILGTPQLPAASPGPAVPGNNNGSDGASEEDNRRLGSRTGPAGRQLAAGMGPR